MRVDQMERRLRILSLLLTAACACATPVRAQSTLEKHAQEVTGCAVLQDDDWTFELTSSSGLISESCVARAVYKDASLTPSNFGQLHVKTEGSYADRQQMFGAGYAEGWLSAHRIYDYYSNTLIYFKDVMKEQIEKPLDWLEDQDRWARQQAEQGRTAYASMLGLILAQFDGLVAGYNARQQQVNDSTRLPALTKRDFLFVNGNGELYDIIPSFAPDNASTFYDELDADRLYARLATAGRCSGLIKVTPDLRQLLMGHSTWDTYSSMVKLYKHYHFALHLPGVAAQRMSFSSYPGELFSDDDLYMMDSNLTVLSTTNHIFNNSIFKLLTPQSLVSWQRVRIANALATSGQQWTKMLDTNNSGTYNNQYMVLDFKRFIPGRELLPGTLWVAEQIPGLIEAADMTETLLRGYWPSYNVPFFPEIYKRSGIEAWRQAMRKKGPDYESAVNWMSYQLAPRAIIFRRDTAGVSGLHTMKGIMRSNDFQHEKLAKGDPFFAVCSRGDLNAKHPEAKGCYDSKVTTHEMALRLESETVNGPTTSNGLPPFSWTSQFASVPHQGQARTFQFDFELQSPNHPYLDTQHRVSR
ncbi:hypothetical protein WJX73_006243 [Symbiochloris irregularis]|uniref:Phospholipase B-like n=1 Tax=Symbiochloris irregularis TaxID=706552 RepID=A0AAW1NVL7_9CHLO